MLKSTALCEALYSAISNNKSEMIAKKWDEKNRVTFRLGYIASERKFIMGPEVNLKPNADYSKRLVDAVFVKSFIVSAHVSTKEAYDAATKVALQWEAEVANIERQNEVDVDREFVDSLIEALFSDEEDPNVMVFESDEYDISYTIDIHDGYVFVSVIYNRDKEEQIVEEIHRLPIPNNFNNKVVRFATQTAINVENVIIKFEEKLDEA